LTGKPAQEGEDIGELLHRVKRGEFTKPRQLVPSIDRPLEAICLKAMALGPEDRYASSRSLAEDVERWMADEPVAAYREPVATRLARWGRRHRTLVAGVAALLLTAVSALTVGTVLLTQANRRTQEQRDRAKENFRLAQQAVDTYLTQVSEEQLLNVPGMQELRRKLLRSALDYYQAFVDQQRDDPAMRADLAQAYLRVGRITELLGSKVDAEKAYHQARGLYQALLQAHPQDSSFRSGLAQTYRGIGRIELSTERLTDSCASFQQAVVLGEGLIRENPDVPEFWRDLGWSYNNLGLLEYGTDQPEKGLRSLEQAVATWTPLVKRYPRAEYLTGCGNAYSSLGTRLAHAGRMGEALFAHQQAKTQIGNALAENPADSEVQYRLASSLDNLGVACYLAGQPVEARNNFKQALDISEYLVQHNPSVVKYREWLIAIQIDRGHLFLSTGEDKEANSSFKKALDLATKLPDGPPDNFSYASLHLGRGRLLRKQRKNDDALKALQEAVKIGETNPFALDKPHSTYELACALALCSALVDEPEPKEHYAQQAIAALNKAVREGWGNVAWMEKDPDLDALRGRTEFTSLLADLKKKHER
jgi:tetratricopeptide (TPR) repeat protein